MLFGFLLGKLCLRSHTCEMSDAVAKLRPPLKQRFLRVFAKPSRESQYTRLFCGIRISLYFLLPFAISSCVESPTYNQSETPCIETRKGNVSGHKHQDGLFPASSGSEREGQGCQSIELYL